MSVEKKFVAEGITKALVNEFLAKELERAGYGGMQMNRTPWELRSPSMQRSRGW